ncbi:MAG: hypothetical protein AAGA03_13815 [Planctomycetota bacterium]
MSPRPTCSAGPGTSSRREIAGDRLADVDVCDVIVDEEIEALVLDGDQLKAALQDLIDTYGKTGAAIAYDMKDNISTMSKLLREFGWKGKFYEKTVNGTRYVIFKGDQTLRQIFRGTRYLGTNAQVMSYGIGRQALRHTVKVNAIVTFVFITGYNVIETIIRDDKDFIDAAAEIPVDLAKTIVAGAATVAAGAIATAAGAPVVVVVGAGIAVGIVVSIGLDYIDDKLQISASLKAWLRGVLEEAAKELERSTYEFRVQWNWCNSREGALPCMERLFGGY